MDYITVTTQKDADFDSIRHNCWSGAEYTAEAIANAGKEEEFMQLINDVFNEKVDETELNDFMRFEDDYIFKCLGITDEEEEQKEC